MPWLAGIEFGVPLSGVRPYGSSPFSTVVVHGGPGAAGEMAPVARQLSLRRGVLEPMQTADSVWGQVDELNQVLGIHGDLPVVLIGFSWGAWLSYILAARHPSRVEKLVLVGSGPFDERYVSRLRENRLQRLGAAERSTFEAILKNLEDCDTEQMGPLLEALKALTCKADAYEPIEEYREEGITPAETLFRRVWREAAEMRRSGELLRLGKEIRCEVIAIHGDYDPHPLEGVCEPLGRVLKRFRVVVLERCGHKPWIERWARAAFFTALEEIVC